MKKTKTINTLCIAAGSMFALWIPAMVLSKIAEDRGFPLGSLEKFLITSYERLYIATCILPVAGIIFLVIAFSLKRKYPKSAVLFN